ncbi:chromo' (CHRromatin Organization MOdifier) domain protein [Necator americanus]|uniref:Chromo' (CHRromatin Organization MOdifier) domain protein n=1 Tax=Necator americanus TaxID=51031 RepID=W2T4I4_NECAM|nr:chromo' (CHRromatin Organization MOdifier) domain protein [Necator americanus]ETN75867.1 chromo' (CHRromatin Organization MOdifier) domain protein [Necator americanus]
MMRKSNGYVNTTDNGGEGGTYAVEKILKTRQRKGRREYLIKWDGWPLDEATWEAESDCPEKKRRTACKEQEIKIENSEILFKKHSTAQPKEEPSSTVTNPTKRKSTATAKTTTSAKAKSQGKSTTGAKSDLKKSSPAHNITKLSDDRVYKVEQGQEIESIVGVNRDGSHILYVVLYKGTAPKHQRMEFVPSRVLRSHAMEVG